MPWTFHNTIYIQTSKVDSQSAEIWFQIKYHKKTLRNVKLLKENKVNQSLKHIDETNIVDFYISK